MSQLACQPCSNLSFSDLFGICIRQIGGSHLVRNIVSAAVIATFAATTVMAEEPTQDWIAGVLPFPPDTTVIAEREVGSTVRMLSVSTKADIPTLLATWEEALRDKGFTIDQQKDELLEGSIEFSGQGISNAKIVASLMNKEGETEINFDATLE